MAGVSIDMEIKASVEERNIDSITITVDKEEMAKASFSFASKTSNSYYWQNHPWTCNAT